MQKTIRVIFPLFIFFLALTASATAWQHATPAIPISNHVYEEIDILIAHGLIKDVIAGQKPYTRAEIGRLIGEATKRFNDKKEQIDEGSKMFLNNLIERLSNQYRDELIAQEFESGEKTTYDLRLAEKISLEFTYLDSPFRRYFEDQNIAASFNPLVQNDEGRHYIDGSQHAWETTHWVRAGNHFSAYFQPRLQLQITNDRGQKENNIFIQELYSSFYFYNTQIDIGRKSLNLGQSRHGGILLSNNARPLDGIQVTNPTPWKVGFLGRLKYTFFFTNLGPEQNFKNPYFTGAKISLLPFSFLELGIARAMIFGGEGAPSGSFGELFGEFFGARPGEGDNGNLSNSITGFEFRGRIPPLRNIELYGEFYFDDFNLKHFFRSFIQDSGILGGIYLPRLDDKGSLSLRLEGRKTSSILYKHGIWNTGWTLNGLILGDPLGADAESISLRITKRFGTETRLSNEFTFERIDSDVYQGGVPEGRRIITNGIAENRARNIITLDHQLSKRLSGSLVTGYERVSSFNFTGGNNQNNFLLQIGFVLDADDTTRISK